MITKRSSNEIQRGHTISTKGLDILCIVAELDELESSDDSTNYCTLVENSSNVNSANQRNYEKKPSKKSVCSFDGCEKNAQHKGLCRGHGKVRFVLLHTQLSLFGFLFQTKCTNKSYVTSLSPRHKRASPEEGSVVLKVAKV